LRVTEIFEKLNPRMIWTENKRKRPVINGFFYDDKEIELMTLLLSAIGVKSHWYSRRNRKEWILQISGKDVETFLKFYQFKDDRKRRRQENILMHLEYSSYRG